MDWCPCRRISCKDIGVDGVEAVCIYWIEPEDLVPDAAAAVGARLPVQDVVFDEVFAAGWSALVKPGCQRPTGFQYVAFGDRTGALGVVIGDCLDQFVMLIEGVLFVFGEEG